MKKIFIFIIMLLPVVAKAQYYNPYFNQNHDSETCSGKARCGACYGTGLCYGYLCMSCGGTGMINCPGCEATRMVKRIAERMKEQRWNSALYTLQDGVILLMDKAYESAMKYLKRAASLGNGSAMAYIGNMYELGMGVGANTQTAMMWYNRGIDRSDNLSVSNMKRIKRYGFWKANETNRSAYIQKSKNIYNIATNMTHQIVDGMDWGISSSSGGSNSNKHSSAGTCVSCGGTGINPTPNSGGSLTSWVGHYNSRGSKCSYCGNYTEHFHDRCPSCNVPRY